MNIISQLLLAAVVMIVVVSLFWGAVGYELVQLALSGHAAWAAAIAAFIWFVVLQPQADTTPNKTATYNGHTEQV